MIPFNLLAPREIHSGRPLSFHIVQWERCALNCLWKPESAEGTADVREQPRSELGDSDVWMVLRASRGNNVAHQWKPSLWAPRPQRSIGTKEPLWPTSRLCRGPHIDTAYNSKFTTQRWKGGSNLTNVFLLLTFIRGKKVPSLIVGVFFGNCVGKSPGGVAGSRTVIYCIISMFRHTSPSKPTLMASKSLTAELQSVCLQTDEPENPFLVV